MNVTVALRGFLKSKGKIADGATDEQCRSAALDMLMKGEAKADELNGYCVEQKSAVDRLAEIIGKAIGASGMTGATGALGNGPGPQGQDNKGMDPSISKMFADLGSHRVPENIGAPTDAKGLLDAAGKSTGAFPSDAVIRVKSFGERYNADRKDLYYPTKTKSGQEHKLAGERASFGGIPLKSCSDLGKAVGAAWFKFQINANSDKKAVPDCLRFTAEDQKLVEFALHECEFSGHIKDSDDDNSNKTIGVVRRKLTQFEIKSLIDDSTSGGIEIAPIEFDDALVTIPVLNGELFPYVNVQNVTRGRRMKGGAIANPSFGTGTEGSAVSAFDTTGFVSAFDTNIFVATGAMEIGLDFEEDSPTNIGQTIITKYGEKALEWLDRVVACGNGTTEPQGVVNLSGIVTVNSDNGTGGPATVSDYEGLMFGVAKQYRTTKGGRNVYIGNETSYRRARAIAVGPSDERRVFGMSHADYTVLDTPFKINASLTNSQLAYANLGYYRMYRRLGLNVRVENTGNYLATRNLRLIVVRMRYGGKMELGGAASLISDAQA